jgi:4-amino-4-deoxy-L-arabinose transferase-like glycosyltransferase
MKTPKLLPVFLLFLFGSILFRFFTYFPSVINHDESTYLIIAQALINGDTYWVDVVDTKPLGIFLLFGIFQTFFGYNILSIRLIASVWVALTAFFIYRSQLNLGGDSRAAMASGCIYIILISFFTFFGLSPNTELFFGLFTVVGFYLISKNGAQRTRSLFLAGLALGIGFVIKPVVMFDMLAFLAFFLIFKHEDLPGLFKNAISFGLGCLVPFALIGLYYRAIDQFDVFLFYTFEVSSRYLIDQSFTETALFTLDFFLRFVPVTIWFFVSLYSQKMLSQPLRLFFLVWSIFVWFAIFLPGKAFSHYTIQFMIPFAFVAGRFFDQRVEHAVFWKIALKPKVGYSLLACLLAITLIIQKKDFLDAPDVPRKIASYLKPSLSSDELVYTGDAQHIIYTLLDQQSPTPYVHRSLLQNQDLASALKIEPANILSQLHRDPQIKFILNEKNEDAIPPPELFEIDTMIGGVKIYQRK